MALLHYLQITASNIRQIEFASQQSSSRRSSAEVSPPVQLLQRQRQDQKSFLIRNSNTGEAPDGSVDSQAALYTPTKSEVEPNVSAMVNNTPHEGSNSDSPCGIKLSSVTAGCSS